MTDTIVQSVIDKHKTRADAGERKYGVTMDRTDLTPEQWLTHLQEELMDATIYIEKHIQMLRQAKGGQHD